MIRRPALAALAVALLCSACATTPRAHTDIGVARIGLGLAFTNPALAPPVPPVVIVRLIPAPPNLLGAHPDLSPYVVTSPPPTPPAPACASAPAGTPVSATAPLGIHGPPKPGYYRLVNSGTVKVTTAGVTLAFAYPAVTVLQVTNIKTGTAPVVGALPVLGSQAVTTFDEITTVTPKDVITEHYQLTPTELDLASRSETNMGTTTAVTYTPAVKVFDSGGVGTSWTALGLYLPALSALDFSGTINRSRVVDACGTLIDTLEVTSTSRTVSVDTLKVSGTTPGVSDVADVATSLGGLYASRHLQTTDVERVNNVPVTLVSDVTTKLAGLTPSAAPPAVPTLP